MLKFEWDLTKAAANFVKHKISFREAAVAMCGLVLTAKAKSENEARFQSVCNCNGRIILVVWTLRAGRHRLISARRARKDEQERYRQAIRRAADAR